MLNIRLSFISLFFFFLFFYVSTEVQEQLNIFLPLSIFFHFFLLLVVCVFEFFMMCEDWQTVAMIVKRLKSRREKCNKTVSMVTLCDLVPQDYEPAPIHEHYLLDRHPLSLKALILEIKLGWRAKSSWRFNISKAATANGHQLCHHLDDVNKVSGAF